MTKVTNNHFSIEQMTDRLTLNRQSQAAPKRETGEFVSFEEVLAARQAETSADGLKFSKHANERLASRNINLSNEQITRLESGAKMAEAKGIKESLVMVDNMAFIINTKSNTVITAVNNSDEKIFTNIDGAVIM